MTKPEIIAWIKKIEEIAKDDDEVAHSEEDSLREAFIEYISRRNDDLGKKAQLVLLTNEIDFSRWFA
jgi:hypothetical protein